MRKPFLLFLSFLFFTQALYSHVHHHNMQSQYINDNVYIWEKENLSPFNEIITSWNLHRPEKGKFQIYLSLNTEKKGWTPYVLYAEWSVNDQKTFSENIKDFAVKNFQDTITLSEDNLGTGFRIKVVATEDASFYYEKPEVQIVLKNYNSLHVSTINTNIQSPKPFDRIDHSILLPVAHLSQFELNCEYGHRLCSPTSTTAVIRYLLKSNDFHPLLFAQKVKDSGFDIYGNWILNVAQAFQEQGVFQSWVTKLSGLNDIVKYLKKGIPVIISVRGPLKNSAQPYSSGHLMVVIGYDHKTDDFLCMDPAFLSNTCYPARYSSQELQEAWERRGYVAYLFRKKYRLES